MIHSFGDRDTEAVFAGRCHAKWRAMRTAAERKLQLLDSAEELADLRSPPGNRLEKLRGDRSGEHSIRINDQWRICFCWSDGGAHDVVIVDYH